MEVPCLLNRVSLITLRKDPFVPAQTLGTSRTEGTVVLFSRLPGTAVDPEGRADKPIIELPYPVVDIANDL